VHFFAIAIRDGVVANHVFIVTRFSPIIYQKAPGTPAHQKKKIMETIKNSLPLEGGGFADREIPIAAPHSGVMLLLRSDRCADGAD
jgi:hypothetical protein